MNEAGIIHRPLPTKSTMRKKMKTLIRQHNGAQPTHEQIACAARELWEAAGRPAGRDVEFWTTAELRLKASAASAHLAGSSGPAGAAKMNPADQPKKQSARSNVPVSSLPNVGAGKTGENRPARPVQSRQLSR